jgi:hypothetical protein
MQQEAEERVAEMGEEMMHYLDEITMLKTKARERQKRKEEGEGGPNPHPCRSCPSLLNVERPPPPLTPLHHPHNPTKPSPKQVASEAQAHSAALRTLQASHDEALGSAQQEAVALARRLGEVEAEVMREEGGVVV